jgi:SAM-dependent methyltransferase
MGGWSTMLAPPFIAYAGVKDADHVLDIGCGTGNLLAALRQLFPQSQLTGVDPSVPLLDKARTRRELTAVELIGGRAEALPFDDERFDQFLSLLVLQEFAEPQTVLAEMRRVTRPGGSIAACQWDFDRMPLIAGLLAAITAVDRAAGEAISSGFPHRLVDEMDMAREWKAAGLVDVAAGRISVTREFASFDDLWLPLLAGTTPSTLTLASLPEAKQAAAQKIFRDRFTIDTNGAITVTAEALVVRGRR